VKTTTLGIAAIALATSTAAWAGNVPASYVSTDHLDIISSGSGIVIGPHEVLTVNHAVDGCTAVNVFNHDAYVQAHDESNDLAVVHTKDTWATWALFSNDAVRAGDTAIALGYPLAGVLADTANVTVGNVSALAGLFNDSRFFQITTPIQPGNSGGGLFDANGGVIGVVQSKLDFANSVKYFGDLPQNVNFAIKAETARAFLSSNNIKFQMSPNLGRKLSPTDVGAMARPFTVRIDCYGKADQVAKQPNAPQPEQPQQPAQRPSNYYEITQDLMLRVGPTKYSASALEGWPTEFIPKGTIFSYGNYSCNYGTGMYGQTHEIWCRVNFKHDGTSTNGWVSAHFLRDNYGNLLACRYATDDLRCIDDRRNRQW
jgi:hypothetical protein